MNQGLPRLLVRRVLAVALILAFLSMASVHPARAASLSDIIGRPDQAVIELVVAKGFMKGYPDGTLRPDAPVTRAEFVVALARSAGLDLVQSPANTLLDLPTSNWASPLVYAALTKGWVSGYPDGTFHPTAGITREESMVIVARLMGFEIRGMATHIVLDKVPGSEDLSEWARTAAAACVQEGMVADVTRPTAAITRAQAAAYFPPILDYKEPETQSMVLATTTSTFDSGLLTFLVPLFEKSNHVKVKIISVGTGQAITTGRKGDADVLLVHARAQEDLFMADGFGLFRKDVMYNDFIIVGPASDLAKIKGMTDATAAFTKLAGSGSTFISRGDKSGTNTKELDIWKAAGITPAGKSWYLSAGQGMGEVLMMTDQKQAYTLTDRATYLAYQNGGKINLPILVQGSQGLLNPYGLMPVNPAKYPQVKVDLAVRFADFMTGLPGQELIKSFGVEQYGQTLFYPDSTEWRATRSLDIVLPSGKAVTYRLNDVRKFPVTTVKIYPQNNQSLTPVLYGGVQLIDILKAISPDLAAAKRLMVVATATDGSRMTLDYDDIYNARTGTKITVVYLKNGVTLSTDDGFMALMTTRGVFLVNSLKYVYRLEIHK
ncbi:MAG: substrate-binding domain-containing protein [Caldiserica bacterium]|nr:substrate-binding domain-containing protein [Caldisericota bacterium]